jgi:hypothetical protein
MKSLTVLSNLYQSLSNNTSAENVALGIQNMNDGHRYLMQKYFFNEKTHTATTIGDQQAYPLPFNYSKLKTGTIIVGNLRWNPTEILTRRDWDDLNVFPYYADIPVNFFIYNNKLEFWPIPSTGSTQATYTGLTGTLVSGNIITQGTNTGKILTFTDTTMQIAVDAGSTFGAGAFTTSNGATGTITATTITPGNTISFNYKIRVPDLSLADYSAGTVTATNDSYVVTGSGTLWLTQFSTTAGDVEATNLWIQFPLPKGDGNWYQIKSIDSATQLTLVQPYEGNTESTMTYTIGQMPLLLEDYHNLIVYYALIIYYNSINPDATRLANFQKMYDAGIEMMDDYVGSKSLNVNLGRVRTMANPNLFYQGQ